MNQFFQNLKQEALRERLSRDEKQFMRVSLYDAIKYTPEVEEVVVTRAVRSTYVWYSPRYASALAALLVVMLGAGTASAAQGSLPGDALYSIKVNVTEPISGALAISDEAKAQWHADVAQTRLEEAETLASEGKLDAAASAQIAENFDEHSNEAVAFTQKVEDKDPGSGAELAAEFDSNLAAHDAILSRVGDDSAGSSKQFAKEVAAHVRERGNVILALANTEDTGTANDAGSNEPAPTAMDMHVQTFSALAPLPATTSNESVNAKSRVTVAAVSAPQKTPAQIKAIAKLKKSAASALADAKDAFGAAKTSLDASTTLRIQGEFVRIGVVVDAATSTSSLTGALKDATVLKAFLKASKNLNRNLFTHDGQSSGDMQKGIQGEDNADATSTPTASVQTTAHIQTQLQPAGDTSDNKNSDQTQGGGSSGGEQGKNQGDEDSFVHHLLNNNL